MAQLRLALAQVNATVGDLAGNAATIREWTAKASDAGAHLVAFPEMALTGYPVEDLALRTSFVDASREGLTQLAADLAADGHGDLPVVVGYLDRAPAGSADTDPNRELPQNCAAVLHQGSVVARYAKHHLPTYGVFDEARVFAPGHDLAVVRVRGVDVALAICEDIWQEGGPVSMAREAGAELLLVLNGSPYEREKDDRRLELATRRARQAECVLAYLNLVGGQDELVFDGDSIVVAADGAVLARGPQFTEDLLVVDLDLAESTFDPTDVSEGVAFTPVSEEPAEPYAGQPAPEAARLDPVGEVYQALVLGLRDYVRKNGMRSVVLGLSGGIDSALVAAIACDALGPANVFAVSMPSAYSSDHSKDDAADLAERTGLNYRVQPIKPMVDAFLSQLGLTGVAEENLQARCRGVILMGLSNQEGHLTLATGNKSELATGYSTIYGDSVGGFAPLKDVPKTLVWQLSQLAQRGGRAQRPDRADPAELHHQAAHRPSCGPARWTRTPCRPTRPWTPSSSSTSPGRRAGPSSSPPASTRRSSTRWSPSSTAPSGSAASSRRARRSRPSPSAATGACRSRAGGASRTPEARA